MRADHRAFRRREEVRELMRSLTKGQPRVRNQRASNSKQRRQQHLLDVKVRSHKATRHRNKRILAAASKILLCVALVWAVVYGVRYGAKRLFFENPDYRLSKIEVRTDGTLQRDQVLRAADVHEGENIFRVNLGRVRDQLQQLAQVDSVQVVRNMPGEIDIVITERKPIAWITSDNDVIDPFASDAAFLLDARGVLMKEKKLLPEYLGLPVIAGCMSETLEAGKQIESYEAKAALELLRLSTRSYMQTRFQIRAIDLSKGYCLLVTNKNHSRVMFGFDDLEKQLQRLEQLLVWSDDSRRELETVNLLVQRNIPVTFTKPAAEVINDTFDPENDEKILKATPVNPGAKPKTNSSEKSRRATPVERGRKN
ncbi:MAG: cell division protein FtsQ/DivIB [Chthoniobacterales bacterium]